ncbi:nucleoside hydrolase [Weissella confusa]|uniref:Nucleoside hydrolase n=1 Tax=Weissella confusa TaxID=1583 RepID=A0A923ND51_WEICO|nr:nucleoside hydrolase [Weissella confusa]
MMVTLQKDPEIENLIGNVTLMGGALVVPGNVTPYTEANINQDPEAADYVFKHAKHLVMVGLDVTLQTLLTMTDNFETMQVSMDIHGKNGIGDVELPTPSRSVEAQTAVDFIIEAAHKYADDLVIVPTGPLTNLAEACLDLDTGVDDALALAYALATPDSDLIGVVSSFGNTQVNTAGENTLKLLELLGREDVPVFIGAAHSSK